MSAVPNLHAALSALGEGSVADLQASVAGGAPKKPRGDAAALARVQENSIFATSSVIFRRRFGQLPRFGVLRHDGVERTRSSSAAAKRDEELRAGHAVLIHLPYGLAPLSVAITEFTTLAFVRLQVEEFLCLVLPSAEFPARTQRGGILVAERDRLARLREKTLVIEVAHTETEDIAPADATAASSTLSRVFSDVALVDRTLSPSQSPRHSRESMGSTNADGRPREMEDTAVSLESKSERAIAEILPTPSTSTATAAVLQSRQIAPMEILRSCTVECETGAECTAVAFDGEFDRLWLGFTDGGILVVDATTLSIVREITVMKACSSASCGVEAIAYAGGSIFAAAACICVFDSATGQLSNTYEPFAQSGCECDDGCGVSLHGSNETRSTSTQALLKRGKFVSMAPAGNTVLAAAVPLHSDSNNCEVHVLSADVRLALRIAIPCSAFTAAVTAVTDPATTPPCDGCDTTKWFSFAAFGTKVFSIDLQNCTASPLGDTMSPVAATAAGVSHDGVYVIAACADGSAVACSAPAAGNGPDTVTTEWRSLAFSFQIGRGESNADDKIMSRHTKAPRDGEKNCAAGSVPLAAQCNSRAPVLVTAPCGAVVALNVGADAVRHSTSAGAMVLRPTPGHAGSNRPWFSAAKLDIGCGADGAAAVCMHDGWIVLVARNGTVAQVAHRSTGCPCGALVAVPPGNGCISAADRVCLSPSVALAPSVPVHGSFCRIAGEIPSGAGASAILPSLGAAPRGASQTTFVRDALSRIGLDLAVRARLLRRARRQGTGRLVALVEALARQRCGAAACAPAIAAAAAEALRRHTAAAAKFLALSAARATRTVASRGSEPSSTVESSDSEDDERVSRVDPDPDDLFASGDPAHFLERGVLPFLENLAAGALQSRAHMNDDEYDSKRRTTRSDSTSPPLDDGKGPDHQEKSRSTADAVDDVGSGSDGDGDGDGDGDDDDDEAVRITAGEQAAQGGGGQGALEGDHADPMQTEHSLLESESASAAAAWCILQAFASAANAPVVLWVVGARGSVRATFFRPQTLRTGGVADASLDSTGLVLTYAVAHATSVGFEAVVPRGGRAAHARQSALAGLASRRAGTRPRRAVSRAADGSCEPLKARMSLTLRTPTGATAAAALLAARAAAPSAQVLCWPMGRPVDGTGSVQALPRPPGEAAIVRLAVWGDTPVALTSDGAAWWADQLDPPRWTMLPSPPAEAPLVDIDARDKRLLALDAHGVCREFRLENLSGRIAPVDTGIHVQVDGAVAVACGERAGAAVTSRGALAAWTAAATSAPPAPAVPRAGPVAAVALGRAHGVVLLQNGRVLTGGISALAAGALVALHLPQGARGVAVSAADDLSIAISADGTAYAWRGARATAIQAVRSLASIAPSRSVALAPDGQTAVTLVDGTAATGSRIGEVATWDAAGEGRADAERDPQSSASVHAAPRMLRGKDSTDSARSLIAISAGSNIVCGLQLVPSTAGASAQARAQAQQRLELLSEFAATERSYVRSLRTVVYAFAIPLRSGESRISTSLHESLFLNAEELLNAHESFAAELHARLDSPVAGCSAGTASRGVGDVVLRACPIFRRLYPSYTYGYSRVDGALRAARKNGAFRALEARNADRVLPVGVAAGGTKAYDLESLLIEPCQRLPRYELLLRELVKQTPKSHPDHIALSDALEEILLLNAYVNEFSRRLELREEFLAKARRYRLPALAACSSATFLGHAEAEDIATEPCGRRKESAQVHVSVTTRQTSTGLSGSRWSSDWRKDSHPLSEESGDAARTNAHAVASSPGSAGRSTGAGAVDGAPSAGEPSKRDAGSLQASGASTAATTLCRRCGRVFHGGGELSAHDNVTPLCDACAYEERLELCGLKAPYDEQRLGRYWLQRGEVAAPRSQPKLLDHLRTKVLAVFLFNDRVALVQGRTVITLPLDAVWVRAPESATSGGDDPSSVVLETPDERFTISFTKQTTAATWRQRIIMATLQHLQAADAVLRLPAAVAGGRSDGALGSGSVSDAQAASFTSLLVYRHRHAKWQLAAQASRWDGEWIDGTPGGFGILTRDGAREVYCGATAPSAVPQGLGTLRLRRGGARYAGYFVDGAFQGFGAFVTADSSAAHTGRWHNGARVGFGELAHGSNVLMGLWSGDALSGYGRYDAVTPAAAPAASEAGSTANGASVGPARAPSYPRASELAQAETAGQSIAAGTAGASVAAARSLASLAGAGAEADVSAKAASARPLPAAARDGDSTWLDRHIAERSELILFEGHFADGQYEGRGAARYANGAVREGAWRAGRLAGRGTIRIPHTLARADGAWRCGVPHGAFAERSASGATAWTLWRAGQRAGPALISTPGGAIFVGRARAHERAGPGAIFLAPRSGRASDEPPSHRDAALAAVTEFDAWDGACVVFSQCQGALFDDDGVSLSDARLRSGSSSAAVHAWSSALASLSDDELARAVHWFTRLEDSGAATSSKSTAWRRPATTVDDTDAHGTSDSDTATEQARQRGTPKKRPVRPPRSLLLGRIFGFFLAQIARAAFDAAACGGPAAAAEAARACVWHAKGFRALLPDDASEETLVASLAPAFAVARRWMGRALGPLLDRAAVRLAERSAADTAGNLDESAAAAFRAAETRLDYVPRAPDLQRVLQSLEDVEMYVSRCVDRKCAGDAAAAAMARGPVLARLAARRATAAVLPVLRTLVAVVPSAASADAILMAVSILHACDELVE